MTSNAETSARESRVVRRGAARAAILEAARRLAERDGVGELSLSAVAAEANFGASTVFGHFRNKDELLLAIVAEDLAALAALMRDVRNQDRASHTADDHDEMSAQPDRSESIDTSDAPTPANNVVALPVPNNTASEPATVPAAEPVTDEPQRPRVDAWLERRLRMFEHTLADLERRFNETKSADTPADAASPDGAVAERWEAFERQQSEAMQALTRRLEETEQRQRGATAEMRAAMNDAATRIEILESARRSEQEKVFGRRSSDPMSAASPAEADTPAQNEAGASHDPAAYEEAARRATTAAAMLADMDRKPAPPDSAWQRFAHSRVRLQRRHYLMVTGAGVLAFVLGAFVAFHAGEAKGRALAAMPAVRHAAVHPVQHARHHMAALARHAAPEKLAAAASPLDRLAMLAQAGNAKAELLMGLRYLQAPAPDQPKAANWIRRAADQHEPLAQYWLGTLYEKGNGVAPDAAEAVRWYEAAAGQGNRKAMHALGVAYAEGLGTQKDYSEAARWFTKAAALGLVNSEFNLGVLYERGLGVPQSLLDAYKWYAVAAAQGDGESRNRVEALKTQLSADDLAAAERAAQNFQPQSIDPQANSEPTLASLDSESPARH